MGWSKPKPWRYVDADGAGWPGGSEVLQAAMMSSASGHAARRVADEVGTPTHARIEAVLRLMFRGEHAAPVVSPQPDRVAVACRHWARWLTGDYDRGGEAVRGELVGTGPVAIETGLWSYDGVAGKVDCVWDDTAGARWVLDWKTSSEPGGSLFRRLLPKYRVQLAGYMIDLEEQDAPVAGAGLVVLPSAADAADQRPVELLWTRAQLAPEIAMQAHYRAVWWLMVEAARARGDAEIAGYDLATLRPTPAHYMDTAG